ncbi:MAG: SemiSWEET transporter [Thermodesulfovibrionales bacterium]|nr:SemiSWEET transporter [Thermodesulfovibrionales bacterium]
MSRTFIIGILAAALTTVAFLPQVIKAHRSKHTKDLSLGMLVTFAAGLLLWAAYGVLLGEAPIISANVLTLLLVLYLLFLKIRYG